MSDSGKRARTLGLFLAVMATVGPAVGMAPPREAGAAPARESRVPPAGSAWLDQVERTLAEQEYHVSWQARPPLREIEPAWQAPNRAHNFRTYFIPEGIRVVPRTDVDPAWRWGLSLAGYGRGEGESAIVPRAAVAGAGHRVDYRRGIVDEFYENGPEGLEQGFTLAAPPPGPRAGKDDAVPVRLDLRLWGDLTPRIAADGQAIDFVTATGAPALRYAKLVVTDARGTVLPSWMEGFTSEADPDGAPAGGIRLVFDDRDAVYPVTIDPLATSASWVVFGDLPDGRFGIDVATAGDVNADGYSDVVVGADGYDFGFLDAGQAMVYLGSASGLSTTAAWTVFGAMASASFGCSVGTAGDVNGDGYSDVIVGAHGHSGGATATGRASVYLGSAAGLSSVAAWFVDGTLLGERLGRRAATAGDVNGDGYSDVIVAARDYSNASVGAGNGKAWVYLGSATGLAATAAWSFEGAWQLSQFGYSAATAGDVNGDGYSDIVVGEPGHVSGGAWRGRAWLFTGSAAGPSPNPVWFVDGEEEGGISAESVGTAGDVNGDGYADVVVGAPRYPWLSGGEAGRVYLYLGSAAGLATTAATILEGQLGSRFGISVSTAGDVNGDGFADLIVGAPRHTTAQAREGRALVYPGSATGLLTTPIWTVDGGQSMAVNDAGFGSVAGTAGDVNGDGYADVIVSAPSHDTAVANAGKAAVYLGSPAGPATTSGWSASGDQSLAEFGFSVGTAGDVNGDGFADVIVGAISYDNGETDEGLARVYLGSATGLGATPAWTVEGNQATARLGWSVGTAGDLNGDGYSDVVVGAPLYDNGETDEGRAYVYLGSATGLQATPFWTGEGDQAGARFGYAVASAGDVDGDGDDELVVGAPDYDATGTNSGRVLIYPGQPATLGPPLIIAGGQGGARHGIAVAGAGDVNRDGYADLMVGADRFTNGQTEEGRAYLYLGSGNGLSSVAAWIAENNEMRAHMGSAVASAGDVNGDGYSDVLVGAPGHDDVWLDQGRAYLYQGTPAGLAGAPAWTMDLVQDGTGLGTALGTAGDVNGDGFADVLVGASSYWSEPTGEGAAFVFLGSAAGLQATPAWTKGEVTGVFYGHAVGAAGDVNGDGYSDVIVGGYLSLGPSVIPEGQAFVYYGNGGAGLSLRPRQRRADDLAPIAPGGQVMGSNFRLATQARTPFGRGKARLEWELKPLGQPFDAAGLARSAAPIDTGTGGAAVSQLVTGLEVGRSHWRMRLLYDAVTSPFAQRSRWFTMPWGGWAEADLGSVHALGGFVWSDLDEDGVREPGEPPVAGFRVNLLSSTNVIQGFTLTENDGSFRFGRYSLDGSPYRMEFLSPCYDFTAQDQGGNDMLDSDASPATGRTALVPMPLVDADETRWSAGLADGLFDLPDLPVFIAGARVTTTPANGIVFDCDDPNGLPSAVTGYNLYRTGNPALPFSQWTRVGQNMQDTEGGTPGVQLVDIATPAVGTAYFYEVVAYHASCGVEGPR